MDCLYCHEKLQENAQFCGCCGREINWNEIAKRQEEARDLHEKQRVRGVLFSLLIALICLILIVLPIVLVIWFLYELSGAFGFHNW